MAAPKSEVTKLAEAKGSTYARIYDRLKRGIELDLPRMPNNNAKAWETRRAKQTPEQLAAIEAKKAETERRRVERQRAARRERRLRQTAKARQMAPIEVSAAPVLKAAPRRQWSNPFAVMVAR